MSNAHAADHLCKHNKISVTVSVIYSTFVQVCEKDTQGASQPIQLSHVRCAEYIFSGGVSCTITRADTSVQLEFKFNKTTNHILLLM